jgi:hypothetical protein
MFRTPVRRSSPVSPPSPRAPHTSILNVVGLKRVVERMEAIAARFEGWRAPHAIARSHYLRLRGEYSAALDALQPALNLAAGRHPDYGQSAAAHVSLLHLVGDVAGAVEQGLEYLECCVAASLPSVRCELLRVVADGLTSAGRLAEAERMLEEHLALLLARGTQGLMLGLAYEARCRVAIAARDEVAVRHFAALSAEQYKGAHNPLLSVQYRSLVRQAELAGIDLTVGLQQAADVTSRSRMAGAGSGLTELETIDSRLLHCTDAPGRAREGLQSLLRLTGAARGFLFVADGEELRLVAAIDEPRPPSEALIRHLEGVRRAELKTDDEQTNYMNETDSAPRTSIRGETDCHESVLLVTRRAGSAVTAGIAALRHGSEQRSLLPRDVLEALVETLTTHGVLTPTLE